MHPSRGAPHAAREDPEVPVDVQDLRYALAVYDAGGFSQAAKRAYVSRQALSQSVKRLEASAGMKLFEVQNKNRLVATRRGTDFLNDARKVVACFDDFAARYELDVTGGVRSSMLTVSMAAGVVMSLPRGFMAGFREQNPDVVVHIEEANTEGALELLAKGTADLALVGSHPDYLREYDFKVAVPTGLWLSVPLNNPLSARPFLTVEDLDGQPVVTAGELNHLHRYLKSVCKRAGVEPWIPTTTSSALEMVSLARSYNGIVFSFPPGMMPAEHREHAAILQLRTPEADGFGTYVARRRDTPLSDAAQRFWDSL